MKRLNHFIVLLLLLGLIGCSANGDNRSRSDEKGVSETQTTLRWLAQWYGEGGKETLIREVARDFTFHNQNLNVELVFPHEMVAVKSTSTTYNAVFDSIAGMVQSNQWPFDIMLCDAYLYQEVANKIGDQDWGKKYLVDLKELDWFKKGHKETILESTKYTDYYGGISPGAYIEGVWNVFYVSDRVEQKLGVKVKRQNMSFEDFVNYAKIVYDYNKKADEKISFTTYENRYYPLKLFSHLVMSVIGKDSAESQEEAISALGKVYEGFEELSNYEPLKQNFKPESSWELHPDKFLFSFNASWVSLLWQSTNPEGEKEMHPCEIPSVENGKAPMYSGNYNAVFVIPKNGRNKEAAIQLMKFITSKEVAEKWLKYAKCPTGLKHEVDYSDFGKDETSLFSRHIENKYNDRLEELYATLGKVLFNTDKEINFYTEEVLNGEISANNAVDLVKEQLNL